MLKTVSLPVLTERLHRLLPPKAPAIIASNNGWFDIHATLQQQQSKGCAHKRSEKLWNFLINDIEIFLFFCRTFSVTKFLTKLWMHFREIWERVCRCQGNAVSMVAAADTGNSALSYYYFAHESIIKTKLSFSRATDALLWLFGTHYRKLSLIVLLLCLSLG